MKTATLGRGRQRVIPIEPQTGSSVVATSLGDISRRRTDPATVELAEFDALRAEILQHQSAQATLVSVCLTAVGVLLGVVVSKGASRHLLLVVPFLASGLGLFYANHTMASQLIGQYIRDQLWPRLQCHSEEASDVPSWERHLLSLHRERRSRSWRYFSLSFLGGTAVFVAPSVGALVVSFQDAFDHTFEHTWIMLVWALDVVLVVLHITLVLLLAADASRMPAQHQAPAAAPHGLNVERMDDHSANPDQLCSADRAPEGVEQ